MPQVHKDVEYNRGIAQTGIKTSRKGGGPTRQAELVPEPIDVNEADSRPVGGEGDEVALRQAASEFRNSRMGRWFPGRP